MVGMRSQLPGVSAHPAAWRRRGSGAQPQFVLTHYTELMSDKDIVLVS